MVNYYGGMKEKYLFKEKLNRDVFQREYQLYFIKILI